MPPKPRIVPEVPDHYVVQNKLTKQYVTADWDQYGMTSDIDRAKPCPDEEAGQELIRSYIRFYRGQGHPTIPSRSLFVVVPIPKKPPPRTLWERL